MNRTFGEFFKIPSNKKIEDSSESFEDGVDEVNKTPKAEEKDSETKLKATHDLKDDWDELREGK